MQNSDFYFQWLAVGIVGGLVIAAFFMVGRMIWMTIKYYREYKRGYKKLLQQQKAEKREKEWTL